MTDFWIAAGTILLGVVIQFVVMGAVRGTIERVWPIEPARPARDTVNLASYLTWFLASVVLSPGVSLYGTLLVNQFGSGFIALPKTGWGAVGGFLLYFAVMDFAEYVFHLAEHKFPWLWSMHSLHHSDRNFDSTTGVLHHWGAPIVHALTVTVPLGLVFKIPPLYVALYSLIGLHVYLMHANVKLDFGRWAWVWTSPSYHRVHHSCAPQHVDRNFASMLPIWDVLFRTYRPAQPGEWPPVGLDDGDHAKSLFDLLFWPVRGLVRGWARPAVVR